MAAHKWFNPRSSHIGRMKDLSDHIEALTNIRSETLDRYATVLLGQLLEEKFIKPRVDIPLEQWLVTSRAATIVLIPSLLGTGDDDTLLRLRTALGLTVNHSEEISARVTQRLHALGIIYRGIECYVSRQPATTGLFRTIRTPRPFNRSS